MKLQLIRPTNTEKNKIKIYIWWAPTKIVFKTETFGSGKKTKWYLCLFWKERTEKILKLSIWEPLFRAEVLCKGFRTSPDIHVYSDRLWLALKAVVHTLTSIIPQFISALSVGCSSKVNKEGRSMNVIQFEKWNTRLVS